MHPDPLAAATDSIRSLVSRKVRPLSSLEAVYVVTEAMSEADAKTILRQLIAQRFLSQMDGDIAQMIAQRLGVPVQWAHARLNGDGKWIEGRGE